VPKGECRPALANDFEEGQGVGVISSRRPRQVKDP
jgi:hypothetical protein